MFRYKASLGHVHDLIEIREGKERLPLRVDADPISIVRMINRLEPRMSSIQTNKESEKEVGEIAHEFCTTIFGDQQTDRLFEFYNLNADAVLGIISKYFTERLGRLITKTQKRAKV